MLAQQYGRGRFVNASGETDIDPVIFDLFCVEIETQCKVLNQELIDIERQPQEQKPLESVMRAAHSIKGAARVVNLHPIVRLAHAMEDCLAQAQQTLGGMGAENINPLLRGVDLLERLSKIHLKEIHDWIDEQLPFIETVTRQLTDASGRRTPSMGIEKDFIEPKGVDVPNAFEVPFNERLKITESRPEARSSFDEDRVLRISAKNLNRLMGLAGESLIESRWLDPLGKHLQAFKYELSATEQSLDQLRDRLQCDLFTEIERHCLLDVHDRLHHLHLLLNERLREVDDFIHRHANLSDCLYQEVINSRMRPFADGVEAFPRMVRDLAHELGKQVTLQVEGQGTLVDREILETLEGSLSHLLRNAVDHGIEFPQQRVTAGKPPEGLIKLQARHSGGMLSITVSDDGNGIDIEDLRNKSVEKNLVSRDRAARLTEAELMDFLFLPGFSTSADLTEISGRGIGLNAVQSTVQRVGGIIQMQSVATKGMSFHLQLPLTLSVIRALIVEISGEAYAFPLARIDQAVVIAPESIDRRDPHRYMDYRGENIVLVDAWKVLELNEPTLVFDQLAVIVLSDRLKSYGLIVDRFIGERELVLQALDVRLADIPDISAGALMEDGSPVLVIDIEHLVHSIDNLLSGKQWIKGVCSSREETTKKRILVVDDSMTVREWECRTLLQAGYEVDTALDGMEAWNAIRIGRYDLVMTDIDMPRMNGIELLQAIKKNARLQHLPVMIVSYKEGESNRIKSLEAGANDYLTKSSLHEGRLVDAVKKLISG